MFIGLKDIRNLFPENETILEERTVPYCFGCFLPFSDASTPWSHNCIYLLSDPSELLNKKLPTGLSFIIVNDFSDEALQENHLLRNQNFLFIKSADKKDVIAKLQDFFIRQCGISLYSDALLKSLSYENAIQSIVDESWRIFRNPIFVFDAAFCLIAANEQQAQESGYFDKLLKNRCISQEDFDIVNQNKHIHERVKKSETPLIEKMDSLPFRQMFCAISTRHDIGHIVICEINRPFTDFDAKLMTVLRDAIGQQLRKDSFLRANRGITYENFMRDLLDEKIAVQGRNMDGMNYMRKYFSSHLYCMVIETNRSSRTINKRYVQNLFEKEFYRVKSIIYDTEIILLPEFPEDRFLSENDIKELKKICFREGLYAGMSNCFFDILKLREYHRQALRALETGVSGGNRPGLFLYRDYYLLHVTSRFTQQESAETFCHPMLKILLDYDKNHHTELADTLYSYLVHERNISAAAADMQVHRNTFSSRLRQIDALVKIDYENFRERQYITLSYEFEKNMKSR